MLQQPFPIGTPGTAWGDKEGEEWRDSRQVQRSYKEEVVDKSQQLEKESPGVFELVGLTNGPVKRAPLPRPPPPPEPEEL